MGFDPKGHWIVVTADGKRVMCRPSNIKPAKLDDALLANWTGESFPEYVGIIEHRV
jgi:hypothetical protein